MKLSFPLPNRLRILGFSIPLVAVAAPLFFQQPPQNIPVPAQPQNPPLLVGQGSLILDTLGRIRSITEGGLPADFKVASTVEVENSVIAAQDISFSPGSQLVLSGFFGDRNERYIIARTIRVLPGLPGDKPPVINWKRAEVPTFTIPIEEKAAAGTLGGSDSSDGGPGEAGRSKNPGLPGRTAPTIFILAENLEGGPLGVDLQGEDGGPGGRGQSGGDGRPGRAGRAGVSSIFDCRSGGGNGGNGGNGGMGGMGGQGGRGGNGGQLIVVSSRITESQISRFIRLKVFPGQGGPGGPGGIGGTPGQGGDGGSGSGFCQGGAPGHPGQQAGLPGQPGSKGPSGQPGIFALTPLTLEQSTKLGLR